MTNKPGTATPNRLRMRRTRGGLTGLGLVLLGAWGAIIPFVGPYFDYAYSPNSPWSMTSGRLFLEVVPGAITFVAGLVLMGSGNRLVATVAGWLAVLSGAWFVIGPLMAPLWRADYLGHPVGGKLAVSVEQIGMFYGLGAAIILLASFALGRFSLRDADYRARGGDPEDGRDRRRSNDAQLNDDGDDAQYRHERLRENPPQGPRVETDPR